MMQNNAFVVSNSLIVRQVCGILMEYYNQWSTKRSVLTRKTAMLFFSTLKKTIWIDVPLLLLSFIAVLLLNAYLIFCFILLVNVSYSYIEFNAHLFSLICLFNCSELIDIYFFFLSKFVWSVIFCSFFSS